MTRRLCLAMDTLGGYIDRMAKHSKPGSAIGHNPSHKADTLKRLGRLEGQVRGIARMVEDENCPNSKIVAIAASKVFAGDGDIAPYSATVNPLDWSTPEDSGFLPTGLQN